MGESVVIADAGPLIALSLIEQVELLRRLFQRVIVPAEVKLELERGAPRPGADILALHDWIEVCVPSSPETTLLATSLDPGEAQAVALALERSGSTLLLDDLRGRRVAHALGLEIIGSLGLLVRARRASLVGPLRPFFERLTQAGIHLSSELVEAALRSVGES